MDIRVLQARLESCVVGYGDYADVDNLLNNLKQIIEDINTEITYSNQTIDSGRVATIVEDLRSSYFTLIEQYEAIPKTTSTLVQRADKADEILTTNVKICNYLSFAIARNLNSTNLDVKRSIPILQSELENYRKQNYSWGYILQNLIVDKKAQLKDNDG